MKEIQLIKVDGTVVRLPDCPAWPQMQALVKGDVEHVRVLDRIEAGRFIYTSMFVNDEGRITGLPRNQVATDIYQRNIRAQYPNHPQPFVQADSDMKKRYPKAVIIKLYEDELYQRDPWVAGDVIFFYGYTVDEVDALIEKAA